MYAELAELCTELYRFVRVYFMDMLSRALSSPLSLPHARARSQRYSECLETARTVRHMKQRALLAFGHTILHGRSDGQKDSVSLCTQEVSLYLFSRPVYVCVCRDGLPPPRPTEFICSTSCLLLALFSPSRALASFRNYLHPRKAP